MADLFNGVYRGKKVLITGHTGFKGSWLALWLTNLGAEVIGYSKDLPSDPNHFELLSLDLVSIIDDVLNKEKILETIESHSPDIIFHMAAQPLVRQSYLTPVETFETNIMGTVNVLEACRKTEQVKAIVNITSDKCYENREQERGYTEDDPMGGHDPYSASKGAAELVANSYRHSFFNPADYGRNHSTLLADVRAGNVIGGGDWAKDRLIPDIVKATSAGETVVIRNPYSTRPWQHVLEPLSGYLQLGAKLLEGQKEFADNWNFGPLNESNLTVDEVLKKAQANWNQIHYTIQENPANFHEAKLLMLDSSKARVKLAWKNVWDSNTTFEKTVTWYKKYYQEGQIPSQSDLDSYINSAKEVGLEWTKA